MKNVLCFVGGLIVGAAAGLLTGKVYFQKKYEEIADKQISDMEDYYGRVDEYARQADDISDEEDESFNNTSQSQSSDDRAKRKSSKIDYTQYFRNESDQEIEESVQRNMELEEIRNSGKPPKIISYEVSLDVAEEYERETLIFYYYDNTLTDEDDNVIDDPRSLLGDSLTKYGFSDTETEDVIYVINYQLEKVYEVQKMYENYTLDNIITERRHMKDGEA